MSFIVQLRSALNQIPISQISLIPLIEDIGDHRRRLLFQVNGGMIDGGYVIDAIEDHRRRGGYVVGAIGDRQSGHEKGLSPVREFIKKQSFYYGDESGKECAICFEKYGKEKKAVKLNCNHIFHEKCVLEWAERKNSCPICRGSVC